MSGQVKKVRVVRKKIGAERIADGAELTYLWAPLVGGLGAIVCGGGFLATAMRDGDPTLWIVLSCLVGVTVIAITVTGTWKMIDGWRAFGGALERAARQSVADGKKTKTSRSTSS